MENEEYVCVCVCVCVCDKGVDGGREGRGGGGSITFKACPNG